MRFLALLPLAVGLLLAAPATGAQVPNLTISPSLVQVANGQMRFTVTTSTKLGGPGGSYVELRGIDLTRSPQSSYTKPDVTATGCTASPCQFYVGRPAGSRYQFEAFLIDSHTNTPVAQSAPLKLSWPSLPLTGLTFLINGKPRPLAEVFTAEDDYVPLAAKALNVEARWKPLPGRSGFSVVISTKEPAEHEYARCSTGTSCRAKQSVPLSKNQEMSWLVEVRRKDGGLIDAFQYCLSGAS